MYDWRWIDGRYGAVAMPSVGEARHHRVTVDAGGKLDDVDEPGALVIGVVGKRCLDVDISQQLAVDGCNGTARSEDPVELLELADAERRRDIVEAVVVTKASVLQPARRLEPALVPERDEQLVLLRRARRDGAALAGRHLLVRVEGPDGGMAVRAERAALVARAQRLFVRDAHVDGEKKRRVKTIDDMKKVKSFSYAGFPECRTRITCLLGLKQIYGLTQTKFIPLGSISVYTLLDQGKATAGDVFSTDPHARELEVHDPDGHEAHLRLPERRAGPFEEAGVSRRSEVRGNGERGLVEASRSRQ